MPTVVCHHCSEIFTVDGPKPDQCPSCGRTLHIEGDPTPTGPALHSTILQFGERKPTAFGRYVVQSRLGAGGFGSVFLAKDPQLDRLVAIKVPRGETGRSPLGLERFAREGRNIAQLRHPGIVSVFNVELDGELPFIVCEYVAGETLSDHMRKAPLSFRDAARLIADVATAVDYAHESGIIHRDIKPSNIMIDSDGKPRLMDFGLAKREAIDDPVTSPHAILGTPAYMSPEQAWGGKRGAVDRRSDIYALGTVLYQLLTRELPFRGEPRMVLRQVIEDDPKNPRSLNADIPRDLETICEKAMQKELAGRYQTAGALADDLNRWLRGEPIEARPVTRLERSVRWCRRNPITTGLVATIAGLLVIGFCSATVMFAKERRARMTLEEALLENNRLLSKAYVERANRSMDPIGPVEQYSPLEGLPWLYAAQQIDENDPARRDASRFRLGAALRSLPKVEKVWSHPGTVTVAAVSPSGEWIFTGGSDGTGCIWRYSENDTQRRTLVHPSAVMAAQFSPDNKLLLTGCADGSARLWDVTSGHLLAGPLRDTKSRPGLTSSAMSLVTFNSDGRRFATCRQTVVQIWETAARQPIGLALLLTRRPSSMEFAHRDSLLVTACYDGSITAWDVQSGKENYRFHVTPSDAALAAVSPDGETLAGTTSAEKVAIWKSESGKKVEVPPLVHDGVIRRMQFSRDGRFLATGTLEGMVSLWNAENGALLWKNRVSNKVVQELSFANHRPQLLVKMHLGSAVRRFSILDVVSGTMIAEPISLPTDVLAAKWVGPSDALATCSVDGTVRTWRPQGEQSAIQLPQTSNLACTALAADRRLMAVLDEQGICSLARPSNDGAQPETSLESFPTKDVAPPVVAALNGQATMLAVGDSRSIVSIFDLATKQRIARLEFSGPVLNLAFTPDGANLIAISSQGHITAWNPLTGERKKHQKLDCRSPVRDAGTYGSLCFLASGNDVFLRDALNASSVSTVLSHEKIVVSCCFSRDGQLLLSASDDGIVRVWSCPAGKLVASTPRLSRGIRSVGFTADAGRFAAGARGGTVRIYQTANGEPATGTFNHGATVTRVIFSPDGRYLVTTSGDTDESGVEESALRVWDTATGEPIFARAVKTISARFSVPFDEDRSWRLAAAFFAADGNSFHVVTATGIVDHFDLRPDVRRSGDLLRQVRIRSGMELDSTGALNVLESEQVRTLFGSRSESD